MANSTLNEPDPPGDWVDSKQCRCGARYADFKSGITFRDGVDAVRTQNGGWEQGGGFRTRGPVLWAMRVLKLSAWYADHMYCGG